MRIEDLREQLSATVGRVEESIAAATRAAALWAPPEPCTDRSDPGAGHPAPECDYPRRSWLV
ncbi:hypothetical protein ACFYVR_10230 [Rhodococcus sp. NPDC003318]|uniref:hypothetical protein n=1 Tax=Rhodococcus sp. NPDC003318 TaxID=3364503 RepID=UPI00368B1E16